MMDYSVVKTHLLSETINIYLKYNNHEILQQLIILTFKIIILTEGLGLLSKITIFSASNILSIRFSGTMFEKLIKVFRNIENKPSIISLLFSVLAYLNCLFSYDFV
jgi:hypothetical protein